MIELKDVSKYYHTNEIISMGIHNVSLSFNKDEIVAITGESGSGKSTLLNVITKIDTFDEGEIFYKGNETSYFSISDMDDFRKNKIGFIFQNSNIIDSYTVLENVMLPLILKGLDNNEAKKKALELINKVGLSNRIRSRGTKLSGGEKQRCVIARALASDCEILACDEPTGNLDSKTGREIVELIKEVSKDKLVLIVTHNFDQVKDIVTRKITIEDGQVVEDQKFEEVQDDVKEEMDLDYKPLKRKICAKVAKNNAIFTPKKSIFSIILFFAICLGTLFMFQSIYSSYSSLDVSKEYTNAEPNRAFVYSKDRNPIDESLLKDFTYSRNPFYEGLPISCRISESGKHFGIIYTDNLSYSIIRGREANADSDEKEVVLIYSSQALSAGYADYSVIDNHVVVEGKRFLVTGIGTSEYYFNGSYGAITNNNDIRDSAGLYALTSYLGINYYEYETQKTIRFEHSFSPMSDKMVLILPSYYEDKDISINYKGGLYDLTDYIDIEYSTSALTPLLKYNDNSLKNLPLFEAAVYGNINAIQNQLKNKAQVDVCSKVTSQSIYITIMNNLYAYVSIFLSSIIVIIVYFLTYVILSRVYSSKKKDYEILRTLGVTKKDMRHIVYFEISSVGFISTILSYIIFIILISFVPYFSVLKHINIWVSVYYFIIMSIFIVSLSNRFNRRLFKFSVSKSLKGGDLHA